MDPEPPATATSLAPSDEDATASKLGYADAPLDTQVTPESVDV
jgi:hypothetical protein